MDPETWQKVEALYHAALELPAAERAAFLERAGAEPEVRQEVLSLLEQTGVWMLDRPASRALEGESLGHYCLVRRIGGEVFKARDTRTGQTVAVRILANESPTPWQAAAALRDPHICAIFEVHPEYVAMEYVKGEPVRGPRRVDEALRLGAQLAGALNAGHRQGVVHGNLTTANVLMTKAGIKVMKFGAAGTVADDLFAFGEVFREVLSGGQLPDGLPAAVSKVLSRCFALEVRERWRDARELQGELERISTDLASSAWREVRRPWWKWGR